MNEPAGEPVIDGQIVILLEALEMHRVGDPQRRRLLFQRLPECAVPDQHEIPGLIARSGAVSREGVEQTRQILLLDEPARRHEIALGQSMRRAQRRRVSAGRRCAACEKVIVDGIIADEDPVRRHPQCLDIGALRFTADKRRVAQADDPAFDLLAPTLARRIVRGGFRQQDRRAPPVQCPAKRCQRLGIGPAHHADHVGIGLIQRGPHRGDHRPRWIFVDRPLLKQRSPLEMLLGLAGLPGIGGAAARPLDADDRHPPGGAIEPRQDIGPEHPEIDRDARGGQVMHDQIFPTRRQAIRDRASAQAATW